ncbi:MAG: hypothetical protein HYW34_00700 [Candidatus Brennerbacteria bacterium]|nr:hypothetical protein [Candidatus Brennerbacteria bacterium]
MNNHSWVFQYPKQAIFYFINQLKLNGGLPLGSYKSMNKGDLVRHILTDGQGLEKLAEYIDRMPIFQNYKYMQCWKAAFPEDENICAKITYGICAYVNYGTGGQSDKVGHQVAFANNKPVGQAYFGGKAYCSDCADANKASRINLDGCDYAVSWLLAELFNLGYQPRNINELSIYEAGFSVENGFKPVWYSEASYAPHSLKIFYPFGFRKIWEVVQNQDQIIWREFSLEQEFSLSVKA